MRVFASTTFAIAALFLTGCSNSDNLRTTILPSTTTSTTSPLPTFIPHSCSTPYGSYCSLTSSFAFRLDSVDITVGGNTIVGVQYTLDGSEIIINTHDARLAEVGNIDLKYDSKTFTVNGVYDGKDVEGTPCGLPPTALPTTTTTTRDPAVTTTTPKPKTIPPPEGEFCTTYFNQELSVTFDSTATPPTADLYLNGSMFDEVHLRGLEFHMDGVQIMYDVTNPDVKQLFEVFGFTEKQFLLFYDPAADDLIAKVSSLTISAGRCIAPPTGSFCTSQYYHDFVLDFHTEDEEKPLSVDVKASGSFVNIEIKNLEFKMDGRTLIYNKENPDVLASLAHFGLTPDDLGITYEPEKGMVFATIGAMSVGAPSCYEGEQPKPATVVYGQIIRWRTVE